MTVELETKVLGGVPHSVEMAVATRPDVAILDISMPEMNGVEAARQIRRAVPQCQILVLTMHESEQVLREALVALGNDREFLTKGDVFTDDQIDAYIELKWEEVMRWETTPSPVEFDMYYSS